MFAGKSSRITQPMLCVQSHKQTNHSLRFSYLSFSHLWFPYLWFTSLCFSHLCVFHIFCLSHLSLSDITSLFFFFSHFFQIFVFHISFHMFLFTSRSNSILSHLSSTHHVLFTFPVSVLVSLQVIKIAFSFSITNILECPDTSITNPDVIAGAKGTNKRHNPEMQLKYKTAKELSPDVTFASFPKTGIHSVFPTVRHRPNTAPSKPPEEKKSQTKQNDKKKKKNSNFELCEISITFVYCVPDVGSWRPGCSSKRRRNNRLIVRRNKFVKQSPNIHCVSSNTHVLNLV
jgi:hypothetical protein